MINFANMKQAEKQLIDNILERLNIEKLNEMQQATIHKSKEDGDLILLSDTGSGKTLAFLLSALQRIDTGLSTTQLLMVVPSRELALQIEDVFKQMGTGMKITACYGGHKREIEENNLVEAPVVIVGTPGRLGDHLRRGNIHPETIHTIVLDEFDKSMEMGFEEEMAFIFESMPALEKKILTSATDAVEIPGFIQLNDVSKLNFLSGLPSEKLAVQWVQSKGEPRRDTLFNLLCHLGNRPSIIFCNHKATVEEVHLYLKDKGIPNIFYHGSMEQQERESALAQFKNGTYNFLITTDLAARGLDIPFIRYIIHYQLAPTAESFTHRNGRTARMEASGTAILVLDQHEYLPEYVGEQPEKVEPAEDLPLPDKPKWATLFIGAGKKNKVNKIDIAGFLSKKAQLRMEDIGLIEVKDFYSFVAVRKSKMNYTLHAIKDEKIKNKRVKMTIAK